jgi:hypothetical protein
MEIGLAPCVDSVHRLDTKKQLNSPWDSDDTTTCGTDCGAYMLTRSGRLHIHAHKIVHRRSHTRTLIQTVSYSQ